MILVLIRIDHDRDMLKLENTRVVQCILVYLILTGKLF